MMPVGVLLLCGRPGPVSVHTPDLCFPGAGFQEAGEPTRCPIPGSPGDRFWVRHFRKAAAVPVHFRPFHCFAPLTHEAPWWVNWNGS